MVSVFYRKVLRKVGIVEHMPKTVKMFTVENCAQVKAKVLKTRFECTKIWFGRVCI